MVEFTKYTHGTPSWVDVSSKDLDGSTAFYSGLFGWDHAIQHDDDGAEIYRMFTLDGKDVAGMGPQPEGMEEMPAMWTSYVTVNDLEATLAKVEPAGGTVMMPPMQVMDAGTMAIIADPTGAALALWHAGEHIGCGVCNEPNTFTWSELMTRDVDAAQRFFADVLDWEYETVEMPDGPYYVIAGGENGGRGGMMTMPAEVPAEVPNHWMVYFNVADVDASCARVSELGGAVVQPPFDTPVGRMAVVADPSGGTFSFMQPAEHPEE